jgi:hypothetical protein
MTPVLLDVSTPFRLMTFAKGKVPASSSTCRPAVTAIVIRPASVICRYPTGNMLAMLSSAMSRIIAATSTSVSVNPRRSPTIIMGRRIPGPGP